MLDQLMAQAPVVHAAATWFMVGLIWFVQVVHYPLMGTVPPGAGPAYSAAHQQRTTRVVGPAMLLEAASAALLAVTPQATPESHALAWAGLGLLAFIWASTFAVQVPLHARLALRTDAAACRRLVATNWARTIAWSARGAIALLLVRQA